jgi:HK97 family phage major capsid protein
LVPPDWTLDIIRREPTPTVLNSLVRPWQTARDAKLFPKIKYTGASDDPNAILYSTGVRVTYPGEIPADSTTIDAIDPVTGQLRIDVYTAMMALSVTNDMMEDASVDMEAFLRDVFQETIDLEQDNRIINGTGKGQARGILAAPSSSATADEPQYIVSGDANTVTADGIKNLAFGIAPQYLRNARFVMNWLSTARAIDELKDGDGNYLWSMGNQDNRLASSILDRRLLGFEVAYSEFMPNVAANAFPAVFGDLLGYYLVQRIGFSIQVLRETKAKLNQIELVGRLRFGGRVAKPWSLKTLKIST